MRQVVSLSLIKKFQLITMQHGMLRGLSFAIWIRMPSVLLLLWSGYSKFLLDTCV
jgi:hypothetical protein